MIRKFWIATALLALFSLYAIIFQSINVNVKQPKPMKDPTKYPLSWSDLNTQVKNVQTGGYYIPDNGIKPVQKVALVVTVQNRDRHLRIFLRYIHPFLQNQNLEYKVYVVNQTGTELFNKGALYNVAVIHALKERDNWECLILHDVDLLPEVASNPYQCSRQPKHMSVAIDKFDYKLPYRGLIGGVVAITPQHYRLVDGFSNRFWAWGGEDDDFYHRVRRKGLTIARDSVKVARYHMIPHSHSKVNKRRILTMREGIRSGLTTPDLVYDIKSVTQEPLFTHIIVEFPEMFKQYSGTLNHWRPRGLQRPK